MPRLRFDSLTTDGRSEMIRNADIIVLFGSPESEKVAWSWNLEHPRLSMPGSKPHEPRTLELIVDSSDQLAAAEALVLLIREGHRSVKVGRNEDRPRSTRKSAGGFLCTEPSGNSETSKSPLRTRCSVVECSSQWSRSQLAREATEALSGIRRMTK
jgi:hypothetical protein